MLSEIQFATEKAKKLVPGLGPELDPLLSQARQVRLRHPNFELGLGLA
jgi:hypothetical protein